jgi:hypothetical protein
MNLDIQTDHTVMRPEWHRVIDAWVASCRGRHPGVRALDLMLRHRGDQRGVEEVDAVATAGARSLHAHATAESMSVALGDALDSLERALCTSGAVDEKDRVRAARRRN